MYVLFFISNRFESQTGRGGAAAKSKLPKLCQMIGTVGWEEKERENRSVFWIRAVLGSGCQKENKENGPQDSLWTTLRTPPPKHDLYTFWKIRKMEKKLV